MGHCDLHFSLSSQPTSKSAGTGERQGRGQMQAGPPCQRTTQASKQHGRRAMGTVEFAADGLGKLENKQ